MYDSFSFALLPRNRYPTSGDVDPELILSKWKSSKNDIWACPKYVESFGIIWRCSA